MCCSSKRGHAVRQELPDRPLQFRHGSAQGLSGTCKGSWLPGRHPATSKLCCPHQAYSSSNHLTEQDSCMLPIRPATSCLVTSHCAHASIDIKRDFKQAVSLGLNTKTGAAGACSRPQAAPQAVRTASSRPHRARGRCGGGRGEEGGGHDVRTLRKGWSAWQAGGICLHHSEPSG